MFCDLHMHSTVSDGTKRPVELAGLAGKVGLGAIALTDHDTTEGLSSCAKACEIAGVAFVPGIEISVDPWVPSATEGSVPGQRQGTLHILGLFVRHDDPELQKVHDRMRAARDSRNPAIVARLNQLGVDISYDEVVGLARSQGTKILGRPHIAQVLQNKGYVKSVQDAFARYIGQGAAAYVRRDRLPASEAIDAIHHAGGLAVLAHPIQLGLRGPGELEHMVVRLKHLGLDGIETHHSDHQPALIQQYIAMAQKHQLLTSGGSDFHGSRKSISLGSQNVPIAVYHRLREAWEKRGAE